ncbi:reverse transcriptase domain, reverse transcriptase zinc-binding domain protein [Tanacetum coccineum]
MNKLCLWDEKYRTVGRLTWISIMGVPIMCRKELVFSNIARWHENVIELNNYEEETNSVQMEEAENKDVSSEEGDKNEDCGDQVANENDELRKNTVWVASEYIVSKSGIGCTPRRGSKKVVHTDNILGMDGPDGPSNANYVADENNKVDRVIDGEASDEIKNDEIGNKEYKVDKCDMNRSSASKQGSSGKGVYKKRKKSLNGSFEGVIKANAVSSGKDDEKESCGKKYRRRSFKLAKAGTRRKRSHSSSNALGCSRIYLNGDMNEKGRGLVKTNVMGPTCSISEGHLKKVGEQIGVIISINIKGLRVEGKKGWVMSIIHGEEPDVIALFIAVKNGWKGVSGNIVSVCLYGPHVSKEKLSLWDRLAGLMSNSSEDWCIFGDFNVILFGGQKFTRISDDGLKFSKLDRFLVSKGFKNKWDNLSMVALDRKLSNHCPIVLKDMDVGIKSKEAIGWELEAESRALDDDERLKWLEARHLWIGEVHNAFIGDMFILDGILITNETVDFVKKNKSKERGVRQGDPLSPFLFILMAEGLNSMIKEAVQKGIFKGIKVGTERVVVSHLQYADDTIFFGEYNKENAKNLMCILKYFERVSGLKVNLNKSRMYGVGVNSREVSNMASWMRCSVGELPFTYLGLPIKDCMRRESAWRNVVEKFKKRLSEWKAKTMSFGGRLTLALVGKWWWRFKIEGDALWARVIKSIYGESGGLEADGVGSRVGRSGIWRDIVKVGGDIDKAGIDFSSSFSKMLDRCKEDRVVDRGRWCEGVWRWEWDWVKEPRGRACGDVAELTKHLQNVILTPNCRDSWHWNLTQDEDGNFKVKDLAFMVDNVCLSMGNTTEETLWNKLAPKK